MESKPPGDSRITHCKGHNFNSRHQMFINPYLTVYLPISNINLCLKKYAYARIYIYIYMYMYMLMNVITIITILILVYTEI